MKHVHIGTGGLGLGLIGHISASLDFDLWLVAHNSNNANTVAVNRALERSPAKMYSINHFGEEYELQISYAGLIYYDRSDFLALMNLVADESTRLLTISIGSDRYKHIGEILYACLLERRKRRISEKIIVIVAENAYLSSDFLQSILNQNGSVVSIDRKRVLDKLALFIDCVVDRICHSPKVKDDHVYVNTESYGKWILKKRTEIVPMLNKIKKNPVAWQNFEQFVRISDDFEFERSAKLLMVNSAHALIAGYAYQRGKNRLDHYLSEDSEGRCVLEELVNELFELASSLYHKPKFETPLRSYKEETAVRFQKTPDEVDRILEKLLHGGNLLAFRLGMYEKLGKILEAVAQRPCAFRPTAWKIMSLFCALDKIAGKTPNQ